VLAASSEARAKLPTVARVEIDRVARFIMCP
jgi:hypothetical protein